MATPAGDDLLGNANIRINADTDPAIRALGRLSRDAQGRIRDIRGRFVSEAQLINLGLVRAAGGGDRFNTSLRSLAGVAGSVGGVLGRVGAGIGGIGAAAGSAAPLLASIVTGLQNIAPAGAVAVTGMLAVSQAAATIQLGMVGIEDAVTAAFDSSTEGAEAFQEALENLAPNARAFAVQVRELAPAFQRFQQGIQNRLFAGFAAELERLSSTVLPVVRQNLNATATSLNGMALGASVAARELASSGTLGRAMEGANTGLSNLRRIPGQVVTALGQLAVAGAPAFDRLTEAVGNAVSGISERLGAAFESGALTDAVNTAADLVADLGTVFQNVFAIIGNVIAPVNAAGGGFITTLLEITSVLRDATATQGFQDAIGAVSQVMGTLASTVGPLLGQALAAIGPVFTALGPPVERLITNLGAALSPIIEALGPVLEAAAEAVGVLVDALSPILPVIGNLIASLLPPLVPLLQAVGDVFAQAGPVVQLLANTLATALQPVLAQLPAIIAPLAERLGVLAMTVFPILSDLIVALAPSLQQMGESFAELLIAVTPLLTVITQLAAQVLPQLAPILTTHITLIGQLAAIFADQLASIITNVVVPAIQTVTALLRGDFSGAWESLRGLVSGIARHFSNTAKNILRTVQSLVTGVVDFFKNLFNRLVGNSIVPDMINAIVRFFVGLPGRVLSAIAGLAGDLGGRIRDAGSRMLDAARSAVGKLLEVLSGLPGRAVSALSDLGSTLFGIGQDLIQGMIDGIRDVAGSLVSAAKDVVGSAIDGAKSLLGISSPSKVFAEIGRDTGRGFIRGLTGERDKIRQTSRDIARAITEAFRGEATRVDDVLVEMLQRGNARLQTLAVERDRLAARIQRAREFAMRTTEGALSFAALSTTGGDAPTLQSIQGDLQKRLKQIRNFTNNVKRLAGLGLRRDLIQQILELGPEQGAAYAEALAEGGRAGIKQINRVQGQIAGASRTLGRIGADRLFDAGKNASDGFLAGLRGQQKQIERLMLNIARSMQKAIRKALGIKSPSTVMEQVGRFTVLGLQEGIARTGPEAAQAMARVARAVAAASPAALPTVIGRRTPPDLGVGAVRTGAGAASTVININVTLTNRGVLGSQRDVENWLVRSLETLRVQRRLPTAAGA